MTYTEDIINLRMIVGYIGEKDQDAWWDSQFFTGGNDAFLQPIFSKTKLPAQYHGVRDAARIVHDTRIGIGRVFHLFRLPESLEQALFRDILEQENHVDLLASLENRDDAMNALLRYGENEAQLTEGPVQIGQSNELVEGGWIGKVASAYRSAFEHGTQRFPYFKEA